MQNKNITPETKLKLLNTNEVYEHNSEKNVNELTEALKNIENNLTLLKE